VSFPVVFELDVSESRRTLKQQNSSFLGRCRETKAGRSLWEISFADSLYRSEGFSGCGVWTGIQKMQRALQTS